MSTLFDRHIELVEAVNNAKTPRDHELALARLDGFRDALEIQGIGQLSTCDLHYITQGIDRPMCCGVFLDWTPGAPSDVGHDNDAERYQLRTRVAELDAERKRLLDSLIVASIELDELRARTEAAEDERDQFAEALQAAVRANKAMTGRPAADRRAAAIYDSMRTMK